MRTTYTFSSPIPVTSPTGSRVTATFDPGPPRSRIVQPSSGRWNIIYDPTGRGVKKPDEPDEPTVVEKPEG